MDNMQKDLFEMNGIKYMTTATASDLWELPRHTIAESCKDKRVPNAVKDSSGKWIMPVDTMRPLKQDDIRLALLSLLSLKNRNNKIDNVSNEAKNVLKYLVAIEAVEDFSDDYSNFPNNVILTDKGMHWATEGKKLPNNWFDSVTQIIQLLANLATICTSISASHVV
jgi:hypothetical protein